MINIKPLHAVGACVLISILAIPAAVYYGSDKGSIAIAGVGALGQVIVAVLLYYLTREQLDHAKFEAAYRRAEQKISKHERHLENMVRIQVAYNNSRTRIGKTKCDKNQVDRLHQLRDEMRQFFEQPASQNFNKMCDHAKNASELDVGDQKYLKEINDYSDRNSLVYEETKRQIILKRQEISNLRYNLEEL